MIGIECTLDDFKDALEALNEKLKAHHFTIEIRAIGGFAMLYNKLRSGGYTMDDDTATSDMTEEVQVLIREVAEEKELDENWINNDSYGLPEVTEIIGKLEWITDNSYSNIIRIEHLILHLTLSPKNGIIQKTIISKALHAYVSPIRVGRVCLLCSHQAHIIAHS